MNKSQGCKTHGKAECGRHVLLGDARHAFQYRAAASERAKICPALHALSTLRKFINVRPTKKREADVMMHGILEKETNTVTERGMKGMYAPEKARYV